MEEVSGDLVVPYFEKELSYVKDQEERAIEKFLLSNRRVDRDIVLKRRAERKLLQKLIKQRDEFRKKFEESFSETNKTHQESFSVEG